MPNSASVLVVSVAVTQPSACGPTTMPTSRKPMISGRRRRRRPTTTASVAIEQQQDVVQDAVFQGAPPAPHYRWHAPASIGRELGGGALAV